ncbi:MAG: ADP-ribosylglycohydrolase family protein [Saccharofermentanales bacterium]|jgi:ADP-ribosylglycohydrolase
MLGAILGDIIGSPYEFDRHKARVADKQFPLFTEASHVTDDTIMTVAVADGAMAGRGDPALTRKKIIDAMRRWGRRYPAAGYGNRFRVWLEAASPEPYDSFGNGSAMRVSSIAWLYDTLDEVLDYAEISAAVTHNHPEGIRGAQATAAAIFLARTGTEKPAIRSYVETAFGYDLSRTCDDIRPTYRHVESCQETVPEALTAFLEGDSFEDVIRTAVSLGGDADTLTAIAGSVAEAFYGIPKTLVDAAYERMPDDVADVVRRFDATVARDT